MGDARRAIEACLVDTSVAGDPERNPPVEIGVDRYCWVDEPSPLSGTPGEAILSDNQRSCLKQRYLDNSEDTDDLYETRFLLG